MGPPPGPNKTVGQLFIFTGSLRSLPPPPIIFGLSKSSPSVELDKIFINS